MNCLSVFCLLIGISVVYCAPYVDVHNDNRPILDVIAPEDVLVNKKKKSLFCIDQSITFDYSANCRKRACNQHRSRRHPI